MYIPITLGGCLQENVTKGRPMSCPRATEGCLPLPSHIGSCFQGSSLDRLRWCWDHADGRQDWAPLRPLGKLLGFWAGQDLLILRLPKPSLVFKFSCWLKLYQSGVACLFVPSISAFQIWGSVSDFTWELLRFQTNKSWKGTFDICKEECFLFFVFYLMYISW